MTYEFEAKTEREAIELAVSELGLEKDQFDVEIVEIQKSSLFKKGYAKIKVHVDDMRHNNFQENGLKNPEKEDLSDDTDIKAKSIEENAEKVRVFIQTIVEKMGYDCSVFTISVDRKMFSFRIESKTASILIGKKGRNLDSIQLLANVYAASLGFAYTRILVDCESYRMRREEALIRLAYNIADKVRITKNSQLLEPLNPYERRIIHTTLNSINDIETKSEGNGLYKQVRVFYKGI